MVSAGLTYASIVGLFGGPPRPCADNRPGDRTRMIAPIVPRGARTLPEPSLKIQVKRVDPSLPLPRHETPGAVGFDLLCRQDMTVPEGEIRAIPANVIVSVPPGYMLMIASRSSLPLKKGLMLANGVGIVDQDYQGPEDEVRVLVHNFTDRPVNVARGERLAQGIFVRVGRVDWAEVEVLAGDSRGGFGSTGG